ncbi:Protein NRT1/ PTR FAMILY 4.7 [Glycine max]|nr:Protein NRT1/ PTR FAMILY 4.7 [Glycine max]
MYSPICCGHFNAMEVVELSVERTLREELSFGPKIIISPTINAILCSPLSTLYKVFLINIALLSLVGFNTTEKTVIVRSTGAAAEVLENLAFLANASNLVLYLSKFMHFSPSTYANIVTNFMGTTFLLAILGGFLADAFITTYSLYLISAGIEFKEKA